MSIEAEIKSCNDVFVEGSFYKHKYEDETSAILLKERLGIPVAYFRGPWLPMFYINECMEYSFSLDYPSQILEIPKRRKQIVDAMLELRSAQQQASLFNIDEKQDLESLLDRLLILKNNNRPLYKRWTQNIDGKKRELSVPQKALDVLLKNYVHDIIMLAPCHPQCHGGEKGWSVKKSLATHTPLGTVLSFDLANAFKNVDIQYVFDFYYRLFESKISDPENRRDTAGFLTTLSTVYYKDKDSFALPQGSPVSIPLFNRLFYPIDKLMQESATKRNLRYTRWIDDLIISAKESNRNRKKFFGSLSIVREDFPVNLNKTFFQQNLPEYFLLGHKIIGNLVIKVSKDEEKNRGEQIDPDCFATHYEREHLWIEDYYDGDEPGDFGEIKDF
ncbi:hypothetical protein KY348_06530 [Candidatus Woesearchaeota archaeon]|nr:hypothetical protein [Candidatus Woesearchaeota archaeon]